MADVICIPKRSLFIGCTRQKPVVLYIVLRSFSQILFGVNVAQVLYFYQFVISG
jgi:hypothetical protein